MGKEKVNNDLRFLSFSPTTTLFPQEKENAYVGGGRGRLRHQFLFDKIPTAHGTEKNRQAVGIQTRLTVGYLLHSLPIHHLHPEAWTVKIREKDDDRQSFQAYRWLG